ncbi:MAG: amidohydrolase [Bacteroidota bacterium]
METLKIALLQSDLHWEDPQSNRDMFSKQIATIPRDIDLIVLPEMFTTGFTMNPEHISPKESAKTLAWMQHWAAEKDAAMVGSMVYKDVAVWYNRLYFVHPNGVSSYDKKHTFTLAGEDRVYKAGASKLIVEWRGFRLCPLICYDLRFPVWSRYNNDYDVLLYVANWPQPRINAWDALLRARAIENMAYCIGVNRYGEDASGHKYPGHSAVYDALGNTSVFSSSPGISYATLSKAALLETRNKLRFLEDRDAFNFV